MDRIDVGDFGRADDPVGPQVAVALAGAADADGFVGQLHVQRLHVGFRINGEVLMPSSRQARMMRRAISPRLAMRIF
jgi:hypothetical protein